MSCESQLARPGRSQDGTPVTADNLRIEHPDHSGDGRDGQGTGLVAWRRLRQWFGPLLDATPDALVIVNREGAIGLFNAHATELFGYNHDQLLGHNVEILIPERYRARHGQVVADFMRCPSPRMMGDRPELSCRRRDGSEFPGEISLSPIETVEGTVVVVAVRDLTDRRRIEAALRESEERFAHFMRHLPGLAWIKDSQGRYVYTNAAAVKAFLLPENDLYGKTDEEVFPAETAAQFKENDRRALASEAGVQVIETLKQDDEVVHHSVVSKFPILGRDGRPAFVGGVAIDITDLKRIEAALRESEERFELAVRGSNAGIWDWNLRTNRVYYSPRWKSMLGYDDHEIRDDYREWESRLHPAERERALQTIRDYMEGRTAEYELEHRLRHKDGSYRWILARGASVSDARGRPYRMVGSHIDITAHRAAEQALRENELQLVAAQRIQQHLLPTEVPTIPGLDIAGVSYPARYAGGDLYDFVPMLDGQTGFLVGDVSGHGFASALVMASTHAFLRCLAETCTTVGEIVTRANRFVCEETEPELFVTLLLARYDPRSRCLTFINAGHPTGYILDTEGEIRAELGSSDMPLGIVREVEYVAGGTIVLLPGDLVLMLTDGLIEEEDPSGEQFGTDRILEIVRANRHRTSREILEAVRDAIRVFTDRELPRDDLTAVVIKLDDAPQG